MNTATITYHFGPKAEDPDPEAKVETMTYKREGSSGPLYVGDWRTQQLKPYATVKWEDGLSAPAWVTLKQAREIAKTFDATLVVF